jgi:hypothetical protein
MAGVAALPEVGGIGLVSELGPAAGFADGLSTGFCRRLPYATDAEAMSLNQTPPDEIVRWPEMQHYFAVGGPRLSIDKMPHALLRRWSELAFWFQPLSGPTATRSVGARDAVVNCNMSQVGTSFGYPGFESHTYMTSLPPYFTANLYDAIKRALDSCV